MLEALKVIAMLCAISAGDKPEMNNMADVVQSRQILCHEFYVRCYDRQPMVVKNSQRALVNCVLERAELKK